MILDEETAKRRFLLFALARLSGLAVIGLGVVVAFTNIVRAGGSPKLGGLLIAIGTIELVVMPLLLKRSWERE